MAKDPAILWYFNDWHGGTITMSRHLKGCYMDLLYAQFNNGHLSIDEIKTVLGSDFGSSWPAIQKKFSVDENGLYYNQRLLFEAVRRSEYKQSRVSNLNGKSHMGRHMENENKDENVKEKKDGTEKPKNRKSAEACAVLKYFSEATGIRININADSHLKHVIARLNEGITIDEMKMVIDFKIVEWTGTDYEKHITPKTLFGTKCSDYIIQVNRAIKNGWTKDQIKGAKKGINEGLAEGVEAIYRARVERERSDNLRAANAQEG